MKVENAYRFWKFADSSDLKLVSTTQKQEVAKHC